MQDWETIADEIHDAGWTHGYVKALDDETGCDYWIVDARDHNGRSLVSKARDLTKAFRKLKAAVDTEMTEEKVIVNSYRDWPHTVGEAAEWGVDIMEDGTRETVRAIPEQYLGQLHFGQGNAVRNELGLWDSNSALREDNGKQDPDNASMVIIERVWEKLQGQV